jgi:hypothetical protein
MLHKLWDEVADAWLFRGEITRESAYAMKQTGMLVTAETRHQFSQAQLAEWDRAVEESAGYFENTSPAANDE